MLHGFIEKYCTGLSIKLKHWQFLILATLTLIRQIAKFIRYMVVL